MKVKAASVVGFAYLQMSVLASKTMALTLSKNIYGNRK